MKCLSILSLIFLSLSAFSQSEPTNNLADRTLRAAQKLETVSQELTRRDARSISIALRDIENVLSYYSGGGSRNLVCMSDGDSGSFEDFKLYEVATSKYIGEWTSKASCHFSKELITYKGYTCLSDGDSGSFEDFRIYNMRTGNSVGDWSSKESCKLTVEQSNRSSLVCLSDGDDGSFEDFRIFNLESSQFIGQWVTRQRCLSTLSDMTGITL